MAATLAFTVTESDTAAAIGSGDLAVLGTPRLIAWCEAATCAALEPLLEPGATSVGSRVEFDHLAPSAVGQLVEVTAAQSRADGPRRWFAVTARHLPGGEPIGRGEVVRVVVDAARFVEGVSSP